MNPIKVDEIKSLLPISINIPSDGSSVLEKVLKPVDTEPGESKLTGAVSLETPHLFRVSRNAFIIDGFIQERVANLFGTLQLDDLEARVTDLLRESMKPDEVLERDIDDQLSRLQIDLKNRLKHMLVLTSSLPDSVVILKMLFSIGAEEEVFLELIFPYLEEREGLENKESNKRFYLRFLRALEKPDLERFLANLNYANVSRKDKLVDALIKVSKVETDEDTSVSARVVLDSLVKNYNPSSELSDAEKLVAKKNAQIMAVDIFRGGNTHNLSEIELAEYLEILYKGALDRKVSDEAASLLKKHCPNEARAIFCYQLFDEEVVNDISDENRVRRSLAVSHMASTFKGFTESANFLKGFIVREEDPYVVGNVCCVLIKDLGREGENALKEVIIEQVKSGKVSLPLACLSSLFIVRAIEETKLKEALQALPPETDPNARGLIQMKLESARGKKAACFNLLKEIYGTKFEEGKSLREAYLSLQETEVSSISNEVGENPFTLPKAQDPEMILDVVERVGMEAFVRWSAADSLDSGEIALAQNARQLLDLACEVNPGRVDNCILRFQLSEPAIEDPVLLKRFEGVEHLGTTDRVFQEIYKGDFVSLKRARNRELN